MQPRACRRATPDNLQSHECEIDDSCSKPLRFLSLFVIQHNSARSCLIQCSQDRRMRTVWIADISQTAARIDFLNHPRPRDLFDEVRSPWRRSEGSSHLNCNQDFNFISLFFPLLTSIPGTLKSRVHTYPLTPFLHLIKSPASQRQPT